MDKHLSKDGGLGRVNRDFDSSQIYYGVFCRGEVLGFLLII